MSCTSFSSSSDCLVYCVSLPTINIFLLTVITGESATFKDIIAEAVPLSLLAVICKLPRLLLCLRSHCRSCAALLKKLLSRWRSFHPVREGAVSLEKLLHGGTLPFWRTCYHHMSLKLLSSWRSSSVSREEHCLIGEPAVLSDPIAANQLKIFAQNWCVQQYLGHTNSDGQQNSLIHPTPHTVNFALFITCILEGRQGAHKTTQLPNYLSY